MQMVVVLNSVIGRLIDGFIEQQLVLDGRGEGGDLLLVEDCGLGSDLHLERQTMVSC